MSLSIASRTWTQSCCASSQVGHAKRFELSKESTRLIGGARKFQQIQHRIASIKRQRELASSEYDRDKLEERVAKLAGGVALIKVGVATETERKELKLRVEDALHATRAAVQEGIVAGGGVALLRARRVLPSMRAATLDETSDIRLVAGALEAPLRRIVSNSGAEPSVILNPIDESSEPAY